MKLDVGLSLASLPPLHHLPSGKTTLLSRLREVAETPVSSSTFSQRVSGETAKGGADKKSKSGMCGPHQSLCN